MSDHKFEKSYPHHTVHDVHMPMGHGLQDQKHQKGNRSPIVGSLPVEHGGTEPGPNGVGAPGTAPGQGY